MAITSNTALAADAANLMRDCFGVRIVKQFNTFAEITAFSEKDKQFGTGSGSAASPPAALALSSISTNDLTDTGALMPQYFSQRRCRDTTLGGNDVLNPLPQFCEDDDILHPHFYARLTDEEGKPTSTGLGQVYKEMYDDNQQIVYVSFGLPIFNKLSYFYSSAINSEMVDMMNKGAGITANTLGYLLGRTTSFLISMPTIPLMFLNRIYSGLTDVPVTRYYEFVERMPMYFRFVNTILVHLSVNMKMLGTDFSGSNKTSVSETGANSGNATQQQLYQQNGPDSPDKWTGLPDIFRDYELDITKIIARRYLYESEDIGLSNARTDDFLSNTDFAIPDPDDRDVDKNYTPPQDSTTNTQSTNPGDSTVTSDSGPRNWSQKLITGVKNALYRGHLFIGFRVEKGLDSSDTFSNQTGESSLSQTLNQQFEQGTQRAFTVAHGNIAGGIVGDGAKMIGDAISGLASGLLKPFGFDALASVATGAAKIDVPEVWMNSAYSKDISFTMECRAPYADPVTILKSEYLPVACWLAASLPRATGDNSFTSPFIARMYSKGFFASPLCMVSNLTIERGSDQNGWSHQRLPLKTIIRVSVKDLSPVMYMYMGSTMKDFESIIGANSVFNEYLMMLSGLGLVDTLTPQRLMWNKAVAFGKAVWAERLNPYELGMEGGDRFVISKMISMILPSNLLPAN